MPDKFDQLQSPEAARQAHRRGRAVDAELDALRKELDVTSAEHLRELAPERPTEVAAQLESYGPAAKAARVKATELRSLAGLSDADYPWQDWVRASTSDQPTALQGGTFRDQLGLWEELAVQREDEAEHPSAYGVDPVAASFAHATAEARVAALRELVERLDKLAASTPNRANRRAAGQRGSAPTPDAG